MSIVPPQASHPSGGNLVSTRPVLRYVPAGPQILESVETWFPRRQFPEAARAGEGGGRARQPSLFMASSPALGASRSVHHG